MDVKKAGSRLVNLDQNHPGFRDSEYRERRDFIAQLALDFKAGQTVPDAPYTTSEHQVWSSVFKELSPLHATHACKEYLDAKQKLGLPEDSIQQISSLNRHLSTHSSFTFRPVAGLIQPFVFLKSLSENVFLSTQYIRHESKPFYTPEPDVIHEMIGHGPTFLVQDICELSRLFGAAALKHEHDKRIDDIINVYWHTLEFGLIYEEDDLKAFGAGLFSSVDELKRATSMEPREFDLVTISQTGFDPTIQQPYYFAAKSFSSLIEKTTKWLRSL